MKIMNNWMHVIAILVLFPLFAGCSMKSDDNKNKEVNMKDFYSIEDFKSISVGESSIKDVYEIAACDFLAATSYGGFCEYPAKDGGYIRIKFGGEDLIVSSIEEVSESEYLKNIKEYYSIEDFKSISVGESSIKDVCVIAPNGSMLVASYGGCCEFPTKDGGCIRIKFSGPDFIVFSIEEVSDPPRL